MTDGETFDIIDLTPDSEGYAAIGAALVCQLRHDFRKPRKEAAIAILETVIDIAFAFGLAAGQAGDEAEGKRLREALFARNGGRHGR